MDCEKHPNYRKRPETTHWHPLCSRLTAMSTALDKSTYHPSLWLLFARRVFYVQELFGHQMCDPECLKDCRSPGEPETCSDKPHVEVHAQKARVKHPSLQPGQDPLECIPVLRLVGVLLWASLRTSRHSVGCCKDHQTCKCVFDMLPSTWDGPCTLLCSTNLSRILNGTDTPMQVWHQKVITVIKHLLFI